MRKTMALFIALALAVLITLSGCAVDRKFQVGLSYRPSTTLRSYYGLKEPLSIALVPFTDTRAEGKILFKEYNKLGGQDFYYLRDERLDTVFTAAAKKGMQEASIRVVDVPAWDKSIEGFSAIPANGILAGIIEEFSCGRDVGGSPLFPVLAGKARLRLYWGNKRDRVVKEEVIEARFRAEEFLFITEAEIEHSLNLVMGDLVEKIIKSKSVSEMM